MQFFCSQFSYVDANATDLKLAQRRRACCLSPMTTGAKTAKRSSSGYFAAEAFPPSPRWRPFGVLRSRRRRRRSTRGCEAGDEVDEDSGGGGVSSGEGTDVLLEIH